MLKEKIISKIEERYMDFTVTEKQIADFFMYNNDDGDFSAKDVASKLYVSQASLSRFSKKLDFNGYREFKYEYKRYIDSSRHRKNNLTMEILDTYRDLLIEAYKSIDNEQMLRIARFASNHQKVRVYGSDNTSLVAREFRVNFMKLGVDIEHITDKSIMEMSYKSVDEETLVIGFSISVSEIADEVTSAIIAAKNRGAKSVIITSNHNTDLYEDIDEIVRISTKRNINIGHYASLEFSMFMMVEILYVHCLNVLYN